MCVFDRGQTICEGTVFSYPKVLGYVRNIIFTKSSTNDTLVEWYLVTSTRVMSMFFYYLFFLRYFQDHHLHQIFEEDGNWATIEKLSFRFWSRTLLRVRGANRSFFDRPSLTKSSITAKRIYLSNSQQRQTYSSRSSLYSSENRKQIWDEEQND